MSQAQCSTPNDPLIIGRTVAEIEMKVVKQGKRNPFSRFIHAKGDKDKIGGWKQDFIRVLHVFNVRSINFAERPST